MDSKIKAKELVDKFIPNVYCYLGSGMLTNTYDDDVALINAKKQAKICVDEVINSVGVVNYGKHENKMDFTEFFSYWREVLTEIERL